MKRVIWMVSGFTALLFACSGIARYQDPGRVIDVIHQKMNAHDPVNDVSFDQCKPDQDQNGNPVHLAKCWGYLADEHTAMLKYIDQLEKRIDQLERECNLP